MAGNGDTGRLGKLSNPAGLPFPGVVASILALYMVYLHMVNLPRRVELQLQNLVTPVARAFVLAMG